MASFFSASLMIEHEWFYIKLFSPSRTSIQWTCCAKLPSFFPFLKIIYFDIKDELVNEFSSVVLHFIAQPRIVTAYIPACG
jgi:hypothetical protein